jgi:mannose-6-phosphate isomerase
MIKLYKQYPDDIGVFSPLFLNLVFLDPGQAMFIASKQLHSYLNGVGIEVMANSDNVLRGGLTSKHIDTEELLKVLDFKERKIEIINPERTGDAECVYRCGAEEFFMHLITVKKGVNYTSPLKRSVEMLLCTEGNGAVRSLNEKNPLNFSKGTSFIIPEQAGQYQIYGNAVLYKVSVPL